VADAPKFEDGLADLEKLVAELETGDLGLDEALKRFEKGVKIAGQLQGALEASNRKVEKLASGGSLEAFDGDDAAEPEAKPKKAAKKKSDQDTTLF
jgi:exodeoxyribonuclease VII small subunit